MNEFTFSIITYNQEQMILENLESMKYQIEIYGYDYSIDFVLSDDSSTDNTYQVVEKWINKHRNLFRNVKLFRNEKNQGIVKNYVRALKEISTIKFKILAGDDLYFKNNVFEIAEKGNFVISPVLRYDGKKNVRNPERWNFKEFLYYKDKNIKKRIIYKLKYMMPLETPGIFFDKSLIDDEFYRFLDDYTWIEDVPEWYFLLNKEDTQVFICDDPAVLYRINTGVSNNIIKSKENLYSRELSKVRKNIQKYYSFGIGMFNPFHVYYKIRRCFYRYYLNDKKKSIYFFSKKISENENMCDEYIDDIQIEIKKYLEM